MTDSRVNSVRFCDCVITILLQLFLINLLHIWRRIYWSFTNFFHFGFEFSKSFKFLDYFRVSLKGNIFLKRDKKILNYEQSHNKQLCISVNVNPGSVTISEGRIHPSNWIRVIDSRVLEKINKRFGIFGVLRKKPEKLRMRRWCWWYERTPIPECCVVHTCEKENISGRNI